MSNNDAKNNSDNDQNDSSDILGQIEKELVKADRDGLKAKLKEKLKLRKEAERTVKQLDVEMRKMIHDFESGV